MRSWWEIERLRFPPVGSGNLSQTPPRRDACPDPDPERPLATRKPGSDLDLAGLVCNRVNDPRCQNALRGMEGGDTWEKRAARIRDFACEAES